MGNQNLHKAKAQKNDEFYTQIGDIENELKYYTQHFKGAVVFCNCDDPEYSNFWRYFHLNFEYLDLKKLITTHYDASEPTYKMEYEGGNDADISIGKTTPLKTNGDFSSPECIGLLEEADIVVTNPPFSLFREYIGCLMQYEKKFVIVGSMNAITYKEIFPLIQNNQLWLGNGFKAGNAYFKVPDYAVGSYAKGVYDETTGLVKFRNCNWFTNLDIPKRHEFLDLVEKYSPDKYPHYDNYDAIEVSKVLDIPADFGGYMGVPISFMDKYCPEQFNIVGLDRYVDDNPHYGHRFKINGKETYARILIKRKG